MITSVIILLVALTVKLLLIVAGIWFVVKGFKVHWGWGAANLLIPGAIIPFCIFHPKETKKPMILAIVGLMGFVIIWVYARHGSHGKMGSEMVAMTGKSVATSQMVGYASFDRSTTTNIFLTVKEIWKGSEQASRFGITNGMKFSENQPGYLPEGAIFLFSVDTNHYTSSEDMIWVRSGRVENMTVQEFKAKIGL